MTRDDQAGSAVPDLDAIEQRANAVRRGPAMSWQRECFDQCQDTLAVVAHCRALRAEVARLQGELAWLAERTNADIGALAAERDAALRADNARLRAALAHYADEDNWSVWPDFPEESARDWYNAAGDRNGWEVARAALAAPAATTTTEGA